VNLQFCNDFIKGHKAHEVYTKLTTISLKEGSCVVFFVLLCALSGQMISVTIHVIREICAAFYDLLTEFFPSA